MIHSSIQCACDPQPLDPGSDATAVRRFLIKPCLKAVKKCRARHLYMVFSGFLSMLIWYIYFEPFTLLYFLNSVPNLSNRAFFDFQYQNISKNLHIFINIISQTIIDQLNLIYCVSSNRIFFCATFLVYLIKYCFSITVSDLNLTKNLMKFQKKTQSSRKMCAKKSTERIWTIVGNLRWNFTNSFICRTVY